MRLSMNTMCPAALTVSLTAAAPEAAASWSASDGFSATSNGAGPWSYGTRASATGTSLLLLSDAFTTGSLMGWKDDAYSTLGTPVVYKNFSGSTVTVGTVTIPGQMLAMHPGPSGYGPAGGRTFAVARWTAVDSGLFDITGGFVALDSGSTDVHVMRNGVSLFSAVRASSTNSAFSLMGISLTAGDMIDFVVGNNGSFSHDSTGLVAVIVPTPAVAMPIVLSLLVASRRR